VKISKALDVPLKAFFDFGEPEQKEKVEEIVLRVRDKDNELQDRVFCFRRNWKKSRFVLASMSNLTEGIDYAKEEQEKIYA
jgi:hypothetical protein